MFFKELREKVQRLLDLVEGEDRAVVALEKQVERLEKQNQDLMDRFMARDFDSYAMVSRMEGEVDDFKELPLDEDADNAGEILEISDDS